MDAKTNEQLWDLALNSPSEFIETLLQNKNAEGNDDSNDDSEDEDGGWGKSEGGFELSDLESLVHENSFSPFKFELVDHYGGEGEGDTYYDVYKVTNDLTYFNGDVVYIKINAFHNSWEGVYWAEAEITRVYPKEVTRIEYVEQP